MTPRELLEEKCWDNFSDCGGDDLPDNLAYDQSKRELALEELRDLLGELKEHFEGYKHGNKEERFVYDDYGRFYSTLIQYEDLIANDLAQVHKDALDRAIYYDD